MNYQSGKIKVAPNIGVNLITGGSSYEQEQKE